MGYELENGITVLTNRTIDVLLGANTDSLALYTFYIKATRLQKTNQVYATDTFCQKGLKWGRKRFEKAKAVLIKYKLVEYIKKRNDGGKITKHYVRVNYLWTKKSKNQLYQKEQVVENLQQQEETQENTNHLSLYPQVGPATCGKGTTNALSNYKSNALSNNIGKAHKNSIKTEHQYYAIQYVAPLLDINLKKAEKEKKGITGSFIKIFKDNKTSEKAKNVVGMLTESEAYKSYTDSRKILTIFKLVHGK